MNNIANNYRKMNNALAVATTNNNTNNKNRNYSSRRQQSNQTSNAVGAMSTMSNSGMLQRVKLLDDSKYDSSICNVDKWSPNIWQGNYFGRFNNLGSKNMYKSVIAPANVLNMFEINTQKNILENIWYCHETGDIYEYIVKENEWIAVKNSILYDYYYHFYIDSYDLKYSNFIKIETHTINSDSSNDDNNDSSSKNEEKEDISSFEQIKNLCLKHWNANFSKYYNKELNKLKIGNKIFTELHPKLRVMLKYYLIHNMYVIENEFSLFVSRHFKPLRFITFINCIDLSGCGKDFMIGLHGPRFVSDILCNPYHFIQKINLSDCGINDRIIQLFCYALLSLPKGIYSPLKEINFYGNKDITDESLKLLITFVLPTKCIHLEKLYLMCCGNGITNKICDFIVQYYDNTRGKGNCNTWFLQGHKKITDSGISLLNGMLQGLCKHRKDIVINVNDCGMTMKRGFEWDKRLIVNN